MTIVSLEVNAPYIIDTSKMEGNHRCLGGCALMLEVLWQLLIISGLCKIMKLAGRWSVVKGTALSSSERTTKLG